MSELVPVSGGCHCGAVRFTALADPEPEMLDCNCSICTASGYLHLFVPHERFTLERGADALTSYRFGSEEAEHLFCKHCGVKSFYQPRSHPEAYSLHYKLLDEGHGLQPRITPFDGRDWAKSAAAKGLGKRSH